MEERRFNARMTCVHETYAARVLGMQRNLSPGIDLLNNRARVEVKSRLLRPGYPKKWVVQDHQLAYPENSNVKPFYWSLGFYTLDRPVTAIPGNLKNPERLESMVTERVLHLVPWNWMEQYPPHETSGQTEMSKWDLVLRYSQYNKIPEIIHTFQGEKGLIHLTKGVDPDHFDIKSPIVTLSRN